MIDQKISGLKASYATYKEKYHKYLPAVFFVSGFLFDAILLERIDNLFSIVQQTVYLLIVIQLLKFKILEKGGAWQPRPWLAKAWEYHSEALNFFLGTLLNFYMLFYFVSSSIAVSALFLVLVFGLLVLNETPRFAERSLQIKSVLFSVALYSFLFIIVTLAFGFVGYIPFTTGLLIGVGLFYLLFSFFKNKNLQNINLKHTILYPPIAVAVAMFTMYALKILPPIPLSIQYIGIYHSIEKVPSPTGVGTEFKLDYTRPTWKFWQHGDQNFYAQPGDKIHCFVRIFAPANFKDKVYFHWLKQTPHEWQTTDRIPNEIRGGREEGYRGFAIKSNFEPGEWRVQVETEEGHEIGRIRFTVTALDASQTVEIKSEIE